MATTVSLKPNAVEISGSTSGTTTLQATAVAGTTTLTLPAATDTLVGKATTDTLTNKTLTSPIISGVATFAAGTAALPAITTTGNTNTGIWFPAADTIAFTEGGVESMRITSSGQLLVGTTSAFSGSGISPKVTISNTAGLGLIAIGNADAGLVTQPAANTNYYAGFFLNSSSTGVGDISCTGSLTIYNTTSDYRLKTAISSVTGHGERIDSLNPIDYQWKTDNSQARGFLAHEFKTVYPNSVSGDKDAVDDEGKPMYQSMQASTSEVIADLVAEIQSLRQRLSAANL